jgi:iron complex outermembrane receptor protein/hemoglobin/transferrin/lactoferrin receptor protein
MTFSGARSAFVLAALSVTRGAYAQARELPADEVSITESRPGVETRATSVVRQAEIAERVPRSAPDALKYEPGVFVQQSSHGQGAPFLRGLFGSRVLLSYDGIRLNNATFRQGPNQYFFTLDAQTIEAITVLRGGASTLYGTDALGGALLVAPIQPAFAPVGATETHGGVRLQHHQADARFGARMYGLISKYRNRHPDRSARVVIPNPYGEPNP